MRINTNISAIIANSHLQKNDNALSKSLERLSSGMKLNRSADDSAGMAISAKMRAQIKGLDQASRNASDGVSIIQTTEGALGEVHSMLQRMRELAVQGANGTNNDEDRDAIQAEIEALKGEIDRIGSDTEFNNRTLLDGSLDRRRYPNVSGVKVTEISNSVQAGNYYLTVTKEATQATTTVTGNNSALTDTVGAKGTIMINGYDIQVKEDDTKADVLAKITDAADRLNLKVEYNATHTEIKFTSYEYGSEQKISISCDDKSAVPATDTSAAVPGKIQEMFGFSLNEQIVEGTNMEADFLVKREDNSGNPVNIRDGFSNTAILSTQGNTISITDQGGFRMEYKIESGVLGSDTSKEIGVEVMDLGTMTIHVGANEGQIIDVCIPEVSAESLDLAYLNCGSANGCQKAISLLDDAISKVSNIRSSLGAYQNRMDTAISSLSVTQENMTSAISRIEDTDMSSEMTEYTKYTVLQQAATAMVAQANERPQTVLQLLQ